MKYTINTLNFIAGVSNSTLRYYDGIRLLYPKRKKIHFKDDA